MNNYGSVAPMFGTGAILFWLAIVVVTYAGLWKVFVKAGKPGWACIIPIYNIIVLLEIIGKPIWWFLLILFPCTTLIFVIWMYNLLAKSFGKTEGFTVGLILLNPIFIIILGFGDAVYLGPSAKEANMGNRFDSLDYKPPVDPQA